MSVEYFGNCGRILGSIIDWESVINEIKDQEPAYIGPSHKRGDNIVGLDPILDQWEASGYKLFKDGGTVEWDMFLPGKNFSQEIVEKFAEFVGVKDYKTAWISRINTGRMAPMHWDVHDDEEEYKNDIDRPRFHCHIGDPKFGHAFIVDDQVFYNVPQGSVYKWSSRKLWHAGVNMGLEPKYMFNFW
jgi:hypothetical protein